MNEIRDHLKRCIKNGLKIYPEYCHRDEYYQNVIAYRKNNWYMVIDNNGQKTKLKKSLGVGTILKGKDIKDPWDKTIVFYSEKLKKIGL